MKNVLGKIRQIIRHKDWSINKYLHPTAQLCRRSVAQIPYAIGPESRVRNAQIGRYTYITRRVLIDSARIGNYCSIGPESIIGGLGLHPSAHFSTSPITYSPRNPIAAILGATGFDLGFQEQAEVQIEADVWIGARAIIADGVKIGVGAIIGANTFVGKDVPPYAVFYGSPPKVHRFRFSSEVIARLLETQWWTKSPDQIDTGQLRRIIASSSGSGSTG